MTPYEDLIFQSQQQLTSDSNDHKPQGSQDSAIMFPGGLRMHGSRIIEPQETYNQRRFRNKSTQHKQKMSLLTHDMHGNSGSKEGGGDVVIVEQIDLNSSRENHTFDTSVSHPKFFKNRR